MAVRITACPLLTDRLKSIATPHKYLASPGTYVNMEGPAFSTKAESFLYRSWGANVCCTASQMNEERKKKMPAGLRLPWLTQPRLPQVIGMTCLPEARLAREAEMSYAVLAMATDYDCWHESHDHVSVDAVVAVLMV